MQAAPPDVHSPWGASSLESLALCPGKANQEEGLPEETNEWAELGNLGHALVAEVLKKSINREYALKVAAEKGIETAVDACIQYAWSKIEEHPKAEIHIEEPLYPDEIHKAIKITTPDFVLIEPFKWAGVYDWKMGQGDVTSAKRNLQLATLGLAIADKYDVPEVEVGVILGAQGWHSAHTLNEDALENARTHIRTIIDASLAPWAPLISGKKQCQYCKAKLTCPRIIADAEEARNEMVDKEVSRLGGADISEILNRFAGVSTWYQAVKQKGFEVAFAGGDIPGYGIVEGRPGGRKWRDGVTKEQIAELAEELGKDPAHTSK